MDEPRINRLSNRHRDVLRGVAALRKSKQIATDLGIAPGTVDGYIAEAVRILGATDRGDAARILAQHERSVSPPVAVSPRVEVGPPGEVSPPQMATPPQVTPPGQSGGQSSWVVAPPPPVTEIASPVVEPETVHDTGMHRPLSLAGLLPIRRAGQRNNDLPVVARLLWIPAIAVILAVGFGMLASGLKVLAELIERLGHLSG